MHTHANLKTENRNKGTLNLFDDFSDTHNTYNYVSEKYVLKNN